MSKTFKFNKLIRDKVYQMMLDENVQVNLKKLSNSTEVLEYFKLKLLEEAHEVASATSTEHFIEELVDCLEVIHEFAKLLGLNFTDIESARQQKLASKGGFAQRIVVESITVTEAGEFMEYHLEHADRYPEI
ncbi:MAG: hypothetical protein COC15_00965 [Legionellales bacterium]|nr:MAG: hypothetical protein COC15_00965 [Legionellales bacterium]